MAFQKIPVNAPFWSNAEDESKTFVSEQRRNVIKDILGTTIRRPALVTFASRMGLPPVDGQYYWESKNVVVFVSGGALYTINEGGVITEVGTDLFGIGMHVEWAETSDLTLITSGAVKKLYITNGGRIVEFDGITAIKLTGTNDPVKSSHIISFDTYLLSNELSDSKYEESILHSKVADPSTFEGAFFSAENKPDDIVAMHSAWDEIALFGTVSLENFYNDQVSPFAQIPGGSVNQGTLSPWTIKLVGNAYLLLNSDRRLVRIDGRQATPISGAIDDLLSESVDVANAEGDIITYGGNTLYLLTINDRTFVYDFTSGEWAGEWGSWSTYTAAVSRFKARNFINIKPWNKTLCTDKISGEIYELSSTAYRDANGYIIRSSVITGNIDHGTGREKRSNELRIKLKRGGVARTSKDQREPKMLVRWRDNGSKVWSNYRDVMLGFQGDDEFFWSLFQLGSYRTRNYEFVITDDAPFSIVDVEEDVVLLR